jgi:hypothetical protein
MKNKFEVMTLLLLLATPLFAAPHVAPNPFVPSKGHTSVNFIELPGTGSIKVFTIDGEMVTELPIAPGEILKGWNVTNSSGKALSSGVYLWSIDANGTITRGKLAVVR